MDNLQDLHQFELFRAGSKQGFAYFYSLYHQHIHVYARKLSRESELARDLTALAFNSLWDYREKVNDSAHLRNYLFNMVHCHFLRHLRKTRRADKAEWELAFRIEQTANESDEFIETVFVGLEESIKKLPPQQKLVVELLYFKEIDVKDIASLLEISPQTVRNHKSQALKFLREEMRVAAKK